MKVSKQSFQAYATRIVVLVLLFAVSCTVDDEQDIKPVTLKATNITVRARGTTGSESIQLRVGSTTIGTWTLSTSYQNYVASGGSGAVSVHFTNDNGTRDVQIDYLQFNGTTYQAESQSTNTGVWQNNSCGGSFSEWLHCNGYIQFPNNSGGCTPTTITPYVQINDGTWQQTTTASVSTGGKVKFGPQPVSGGSWNWSGPNGFSASTREVTISNIQSNQAGNYIATYTNSGGCQSNSTFNVTVTGSGGGDCVTGTINSGSYFLMNNVWGSGAGSQCIWLNSTNSWGVNASHTGSGIKAYPALVRGCHWSACSSNSGLPKQINSLGSVNTSWTQSFTGSAGNAAYDIWFDNSSNPGNRAAQYELMLWLQYRNQQPIAENYDGNGNAIPFASNVSLGGRTWNVYRRGDVFSFLLTSQSSSINVSVKPIIDYCVARGWMSSSAYLISVQAGWEIIQGGTCTTTAYSLSGL